MTGGALAFAILMFIAGLAVGVIGMFKLFLNAMPPWK